MDIGLLCHFPFIVVAYSGVYVFHSSVFMPRHSISLC